MSFDGCDWPQFFSEALPIARKNHKCCECGKPIPKGMKYWRCSGKWDGQVDTFKQHIECRHACYTFQVEYRECIPFGALFEQIHEWGTTWEKAYLRDEIFLRKKDDLEKQVRGWLAKGLRASRLKSKDQIAAYNSKHSSETP